METAVAEINHRKNSELPRQDSAETLRRINSTELFAGKKQVFIEHEGHEYVLRLTSQGKLILTK